MKLLIVEDQSDLRHTLYKRLNEEGYVVDQAKDGEEAWDLIQYGTYDAVILDIMIPHINGLEVLTKMRQEKMITPVLLLTAKDTINDRVLGLNLGADDYLVKPFAYEELLARIRSLLRRKGTVVDTILSLDNLTLNRTTKEVKRGNNIISLTKKEFNILEYLLLNKGIIVTREQLEQVSTNYDYDGYSNVIDVYIRFLRKKIDEKYNTKLIHTKRGFGYVMKVKK